MAAIAHCPGGTCQSNIMGHLMTCRRCSRHVRTTALRRFGRFERPRGGDSRGGTETPDRKSGREVWRKVRGSRQANMVLRSRSPRWRFVASFGCRRRVSAFGRPGGAGRSGRIGMPSGRQVLRGRPVGKVSSRWWRSFWRHSSFAECDAGEPRLRSGLAETAAASRLQALAGQEFGTDRPERHRRLRAAGRTGKAQRPCWTWSFGFLRERGCGAGNGGVSGRDTGWTRIGQGCDPSASQNGTFVVTGQV